MLTLGVKAFGPVKPLEIMFIVNNNTLAVHVADLNNIITIIL